MLLLAGVGGVGYWGWGLFLEQIEQALNENPVIQEHIGQVESLKADLVATGELESDDAFVFRVEGPKGSGVVSAEFVSVSEDREEIRSGTLEMSTGETYDLVD